jgi:predicted GNAT family acetyltransferase
VHTKMRHVVGIIVRLPSAAASLRRSPVCVPREARCRGYARTAVELCLRGARERKVPRAILFTGEDTPIKAYRALGFARIGDFAIVLLSSR